MSTIPFRRQNSAGEWAGAGGSIGVECALGAPADGYTIV
jgi:hypothetical protein